MSCLFYQGQRSWTHPCAFSVKSYCNYGFFSSLFWASSFLLFVLLSAGSSNIEITGEEFFLLHVVDLWDCSSLEEPLLWAVFSCRSLLSDFCSLTCKYWGQYATYLQEFNVQLCWNAADLNIKTILGNTVFPEILAGVRCSAWSVPPGAAGRGYKQLKTTS